MMTMYSIVPVVFGGSLISMPLPINVMRAMNNPIGMLYGKVRSTGWHHGWDLFADVGTDVLTIDSGEIAHVWDSGNGPKLYGKQVSVRLDNLKHEGQAVYFFVAHLSSWFVHRGQRVKAGQVIGQTGISGNGDISAPHLHFELRRNASGSAGRIDPRGVFSSLYDRYVLSANMSPNVLRRW